MIGDHITEELLAAYQCGDISSEAFQRRILRHLQSKCEVCYKELERWRRTRLSRRFSLRLLAALAEEGVPPIGDEREAKKDLTTLLPLTVPDRERKVTRALRRFRSPLLARALVQEAIGELGHDVEEATHLLDLAFLVLEHGKFSAFRREVEAHALGVRAMVFRLHDDLDTAEKLFGEARRILPRHGIVDLLLAAELDEMEGSCLKDRQAFVEAEKLLARSIALYKLLGDDVRQARALLVLAAVHFHSKQFDRAISDAKQILELVPEHKAYSVMAAHAVSLYLAESGRPQEAARYLKEHQPRYKQAEGFWRFHDLHFHWLAGKISYGLGRYDQAEAHLTKARDGFAERDTSPYDAILVSFDLALVFDAVGKYQELLEVTSIISGELARESLHAESSAAVTLFLKAAAKQAITEELVREISRFLQFSRTDPTLKCEISLES